MVCKDNILNDHDPRKDARTGVLLIPDWTTLDLISPFFDSRANKYFITVPTENDVPGIKLQQILNDAKPIGVKSLLRVYGRKESQNNINTLLIVSETPDWFVPERPNPKCGEDDKVVPLFGMKVLVSVPSKTLDSIPRLPVPSGSIHLPPVKQEITLFSSELRTTIKAAAIRIRKYGDDVSNLKGRININLNKEAQRLEDFVSVLENLLIANGFSLRPEQNDLIILGVDQNNKISYVLFDNGKSFVRLSVGFENFLQTRPVNDDRTIVYLSHLDEINEMGSKRPEASLTDFLKNFTARTPEIKLTSDLTNLIGNDHSVGELISSSNKKKVLSEEEKDAEDMLLASVEFKASILEDNLHRIDFVGDAVLDVSNFDKLLQKVNSLEDVYQEILNKVSLQSIIAMAIKCFPLPDPCVLVRAFLKSLKPSQLLSTLAEKAGIAILKIPQLESPLRTGIKTCINSLSIEDQLNIFGLLSAKANVRINNIDDLTIIPLQGIIDVFEGKNLIKKVIEDNFVFDIIEATLEGLCARLVVRHSGGEFSIDFNIDLDINIPEIPKFEIPTITLDDLLPTADIMAEISIQIESAIIDALVAALVDTIKNIIKGILENCGDIPKLNFGSINLNDLLARSFNLNINAEAFIGLQSKLFSELSADAAQISNFANSFSNFLNDLSALLSPAEISNTLSGNISPEVGSIINCLVSNKYSNIKPLMATPTGEYHPAKTEDLFQNIGGLINKQLLLDQIAIRSEGFGTTRGFCDPPDNNNQRDLLKTKGLTPDQINQQIAMSNKRKSDRLHDLLHLLNKNKPLDNIIPPVFCKNNDEKNKGMIPRDHPSFTHMLNKTVDVMYDGIHIAFDQDINGFPIALKETTTTQAPRVIPRKTKFTDPNGNSADIANPEFLRIVAQGTSVKDPDKTDGDPVTIWEDQTFTTGFVAKGLKQNLENMEFNPKLFNFDSVTGRISFIIPNGLDASVLTTPPSSSQILSLGPQATPFDTSSFSSSNAPITSSLLAVQTLSQSQGEIGQLQTIEQYIDYILPTDPSPEIDNFTFTVNEKNTSSSVAQEVFRVSKSSPIPSNILSFIRNNNLDLLSNTSAPQSYFSAFITDIWKNGAPIYRDGNSLVNPDYAKGIGSPLNLHEINTNFRDKVKNEIYDNIFTDIFAALSRQVAQSPMFDSKVLSLVNFTPDKQPNGCKPSLLDLEGIKNRMKNDFNNASCSEDLTPSIDGFGKSSPNTLEQSGISGAVLTFIRLFTIEFVLRSIFVFSEFKLSENGKADDVVISYFINAINKGIADLSIITNDANFSSQFNEQVLKTYNTRIEKGELDGSKTSDLNVALNILIKEQVSDVIDKLSGLITHTDIEISGILIEEWLPLFDVADGSLRLATADQINLRQAISGTTENQRKDYQAIFNLDNGNLILERYVRIDEKTITLQAQSLNARTALSPLQLIRTSVSNNVNSDGIIGVANIPDFDGFIFGALKQRETLEGHRINLANEFAGVSYGLRLSYVLPTEKPFNTNPPVAPGGAPTKIATVLNDGSFTNGLFTNDTNDKVNNESRLDKAFQIFEGNNTTIRGDYLDTTQPQTLREINLFPIVSVELKDNILATLTTDDRTQDSIEKRWNDRAQQLRDALVNTNEFKFLFNYSFPLDRMMSLMILYNIVYLSNVKKLVKLFNGTKTSLKTTFQALLNSGNYKYDDPYITKLGGNAGASTTAQNNANTDTDIPGLSLPAIAARTPFLILKGLVELTDTNIGRARKIVDTAKEHNKNIPIQLASIAQLPMNVFPPPPFGPGIGPPITPLGILYLALDIDGIFNSAQGKDVKRKLLTDQFGAGFNLNAGIPKLCPDNQGAIQ